MTKNQKKKAKRRKIQLRNHNKRIGTMTVRNQNTLNEVRVTHMEDLGAETLDVDPKNIPTLVPDKIMAEWQNGDSDPYYKIQKIPVPVTANGMVYTQNFFESFLSKAQKTPIPGSKDGHDERYGKRAPTDFILVGGKVETNSDGVGFVFFKNYIPLVCADGSSNKQFITENKSGMVHYSLVSHLEYLRTDDPVTGDYVYTALRSLKGERNDAVPLDLGAMTQVTNAVNDGGKIKKEKESLMNKDEVLKAVKTFMENGTLGVGELATTLGINSKIVNPESVAAVELKKSLDGIKSADPVTEIVALRKQVAEDGAVVANAQLDLEFGASRKDTAGVETNLLRSYAADKLKGVDRAKFTEAVNAVKADPIAKKLASEAVDANSTVNVVEGKVANAAAPVGNSAGIDTAKY